MSKIEHFVLISLGFLTFSLVFIRVGFFFGSSINKYSLILSFLMYCLILIYVYASLFKDASQRFLRFLPLTYFIGLVSLLSLTAVLLNYTYDTSWDGQGYHQSAVIALGTGWNPVMQLNISFKQNLPSQIFAEGYPSALWEIEGAIYALTNKINSAKVLNIGIAIVAYFAIFALLKKLKLNNLTSIILSFLMVMQPVYLIQLLTFMEDGFGYQLLLIAGASLAILIVSPKTYWSAALFIMAELFLVTTKYSHLPVALVLGIIFLLVFINRVLNREYILNLTTKLFIALIFSLSLIFGFIPYLRNGLAHEAIFYPTNIPDLMGSVKYNNVPNNLQDSSKLSLLFHGLFSKSQSKESGDPRSESNVAELKVPFTFTPEELEGSAELYNNRVGGGGPLFSGIVILSIILLTIAYFKADSQRERYSVYAAIFGFGLVILLSLLAPTPNLLRYVNQLQLIPFLVIIPLLSIFTKKYIHFFSWLIISISIVNFLLYFSVVVDKNIRETNLMNQQFQTLRESGREYQVRAQQFYSSYIVLNEQNVPFTVVDRLECDQTFNMYASSTTTQYCFK